MSNELSLKAEMARNNCHYVAEVLKTLSHPGRLLILCMLSNGEKSVSELEELCGIGQSQVSQFLKRMQYENIVNSRKDGKFVLYSIADHKITALITQLSNIFCELPAKVG